MYKAKMKKYKEKLLDCDDKYSQACVTIWLVFVRTVLAFILKV